MKENIIGKKRTDLKKKEIMLPEMKNDLKRRK